MLPQLLLSVLCSGYHLVVGAEPVERFQLFSDLVRDANNRTSEGSTPLLSLGDGPPSDSARFRFYNNDTSGRKRRDSICKQEED
jgi:hypothetical protein